MLAAISDSCCGSISDPTQLSTTDNGTTSSTDSCIIRSRDRTNNMEMCLNKPPPADSNAADDNEGATTTTESANSETATTSMTAGTATTTVTTTSDGTTTALKSTLFPTTATTKVQQQPPPTPQPTYSNSSSAIQSAIIRLKDLSVNFVALDFDQTILDIHTGGRWTGTVNELFPHVRPVFVGLMRACIAGDIQVAIVTFSQQTSVVRGVLDSILKDDSTKVPIRGSDRTWSYRGKGSQQGKQPHMASAVEELEHRFGVEITKQSTLLIDDDPRNIRHALNNGTRAIWFNPSKPHRLLPEMIKLV